MNRDSLMAIAAAAAIATLVAAAAAVGPTSAGASTGSGSSASSCTARFYGGAMHLCGPAVANFRGFTYVHGTCKPASPSRTTQSFIVELGELHPGDPTNAGRAYLKIEVDGPFTSPTSGHVISWLRGKRWAGYGESFAPKFVQGRFATGTFVATRTATGIDPKRGSFRCGG
jgi:hypothetical protein